MHFHKLRDNLCWDNIPAAPKIQPGGEAGGNGTEFFCLSLEMRVRFEKCLPTLHCRRSSVEASVIQQRLKGRKTNQMMLQNFQAASENTGSTSVLSLSGLISAQDQDEHTPDAGESSPTYCNYEDVPESNKATEKRSICCCLSGTGRQIWVIKKCDFFFFL